MSLHSVRIACSWRLDRRRAVLCGWGDFLEDGTAPKALASLVTRRLLGAKVRSPAWDLELRFAGDLYLRAFCDITAGTANNYAVQSQGRWYGVGPAGQIAAG